MPSLSELAERSGVAPAYEGVDGRLVQVPEATLRAILSSLNGPAAHDYKATNGEGQGPTCYLPQFLQRGRAWGISLQLYELRSSRNAGIGDFADLADFCRLAGAMGADFVGCNPLHALLTAEPGRCSPFFPSNRRFLNPLYIALDRVEDVAWGEQHRNSAARLREEQLVNYEGVSRLKMAMLREAWLRWKGAERPDRDDYGVFRAKGGDALRKHAIFEALSWHFVGEGLSAGWRQWPAAYQDHRAAAVADFAHMHDDDIGFHIWLQWIADRQLRAASKAASDFGMRIGLYLDLAVAEAPDGSATWSEPDRFLTGMKIGAPPDVFSAEGQDWGLAPLSPSLFARHSGPSYFGDLLENVAATAGALRIDHAMSIQRLFIIPEDQPARCGTYVRYPMQQMLELLAVRSQDSQTIIIGEDLGNVPDGFRDAMRTAGVLSYRVLCFEHQAGKFVAAGGYPRLSLACVTTHDLPPLRAWWASRDVEFRLDHGLINQREAAQQRAERQKLTEALQHRLKAEGILLVVEESIARDDWHTLNLAIHRFIARTPSVLAAVRLADMTGETAPTNIPGTAESYPNWRPKSSLTLEAIDGSPEVRALARLMAEERPR